MGGDELCNGPLKVILDEDALPPLPDLIARLARARAAGRSFAFHCVTHVELLFALSALQAVASDRRDRIEHASLVCDEVMPLLRDSGVSWSHSLIFVAARKRYLQTLSGDEIDHLYRHASIAAAGINVVVSSDAPYGPLNLTEVIHAATERRTREGMIIGADEGIAAETALVSYLRQPLVSQHRPGVSLLVVMQISACCNSRGADCLIGLPILGC